MSLRQRLSAGGYVDPSIVPTRGIERALIAEIERRGLSLHRLHRDGRTVRLTGPGVHVLCEGLGCLSFSDLMPFPWIGSRPRR